MYFLSLGLKGLRELGNCVGVAGDNLVSTLCVVVIRSDKGKTLETSAIVSFTAPRYPHQHTVDTPVHFPCTRVQQPRSSARSYSPRAGFFKARLG